MQKGSLVICIANVFDHKWMEHCICGCSRSILQGPNKEEIVTIGGFDNQDNPHLLEYPQEPGIGGFPKKYFREIQEPMDVTNIVEEAINNEVLC